MRICMEILIFPLKIMIFEQNPGILGLWEHSEGFLEVPRGVNCAHIGIIRGYLRFNVDWWAMSTFLGRKLGGEGRFLLLGRGETGRLGAPATGNPYISIENHDF